MHLTIDEVFNLIMKQTDYKFIYQEGIFNTLPKVSLKKGIIEVNDLLNKSLSSGNFNVIVTKNKTVLIKEKVTEGKIKNQEYKVTGKVVTKEGEPLPGANILEKGTTNGSVTDFDGNFTLSISKPNAILVVSYIGFETKEVSLVKNRTDIVITLEDDSANLDEIVIVGSRNPNRTSLETATAIDVIDVQEVSTTRGKVEINQILQYIAPSFNSNKQSGSDGADHIDPATLRGLGPDQTLVLINGKRRHSSSLVNLFGTRGRGNTGSDLNAIPSAAIKRIEILRDGAAAQYGSDAIAGVINIVLKSTVDKITGSISYGAYNANTPGDFPNKTPNTKGNRLDTENDGNAIGKDRDFDGGSVKIEANFGTKLGNNGGFVNVTTEYLSKNKTLRPGQSFRKGFGTAAIQGFNVFANASIPLNDKTKFYVFGGRNYRDTDAYAFTRKGNDLRKNVPSIYPNGFTPRITSIILDKSVSTGFKTTLASGWNLDVSNTWGKNYFHYFIKGTLNATLGASSPTEFDAGGHSLSQNTVNLDVSKFYEDVAQGLNLAFGTEFRTENFIIFAGEEASYAAYDANGLPITNPTIQKTQTVTHKGNKVPIRSGSQGFPGYSPKNEVDRDRSNLSFYADSELDLSKSFLVAAALRFEKYSDFGSTFNGKLATRVKLNKNVNLRSSISTGFRAPSLTQIYYNLISTDFVDGVAEDVLLSPNNSPVTRSFGVGPLKEETALNTNIGATAKFGNFSATVDAYFIDIKNRITLTGRFAAPNIPNVKSAKFFTNSIDTKTRGIDMVISWKKRFDNGSLSASLAGNINSMKIEKLHNGSLDADTFLSKREKLFLLASSPDSKYSFNMTYKKNKFTTGLGLTRFSKVVLFDDSSEDIYNPKITTDINLGLDLAKNITLTLGGNNIFNVYPDQQDDGNTSSGGYFDAVQMGFSGAYYYTRLGFSF